MKRHLTKFVTLIGLTLMLILPACNLNASETETPTPIPAATPTQAQEPEGLCANPLFPVKLGATWTYAGTGSVAGDYGFTDTITDVREDGFSLTSQFDDLTRTQEWNCKPEGLAALTFGGGAAGGVFANGIQMDLNTSNVQGVNLPKTVNAGDQWPYSLDFEGDIRARLLISSGRSFTRLNSVCRRTKSQTARESSPGSAPVTRQSSARRRSSSEPSRSSWANLILSPCIRRPGDPHAQL